MISDKDRQAIVEEAKTWVGTPYRHCADIKGAGVDCAMILSRVYSNVGIIPYVDPRPYPTDWMFHRSEERYLETLMQYADEIDTPPQAGDFILFRYGRTFSHSAIVINYPLVIHAHAHDRMVVYADATQSPLKDRESKAFTMKRIAL